MPVNPKSLENLKPMYKKGEGRYGKAKKKIGKRY
jgi:hypothetical protein